ncbi:MAG TPA: hypothetical protein VG456_06910 [Candidatus Sulfopaludibacter sp.]|jgi:hypothetical protein|nr:hypothetical protein [Candidatus Sulfopaludibacter sp.]
MRDPRLGDDIDDFCVRCKRVMNHAIVSVVNNEAAKVRCRTCHNDHDFRHEQAPPPKVDLRKAALFSEVLKKVAPGDADGAAVVDGIDPELDVELDETAEVETETDEMAEVEVDAEPEPAPPVEIAKPKAKAKGKGRKA